MLYDKTLKCYMNENETFIAVLFDDDDNVLAYDYTIMPMYPAEECIARVLYNYIEDIEDRLDTELSEEYLKGMLGVFNIDFVEYVIDDFALAAIISRLE